VADMQTMRDVIKEAKGTFISFVRRSMTMSGFIADLGPDNPHTTSSLGNEKDDSIQKYKITNHSSQLGCFLFAVCSSSSFNIIPFSD
jgi:hypothetical protein